MKLYEIRKFKNGFKLSYARNIDEKLTLNFWLNKYNINDYWIYKSTDKFRRIEIDELLQEKYSQYTFFHKDFYNKDNIDKSIRIIYDKDLMIKFLIKPLPPLNILQKIKIIDKI